MKTQRFVFCISHFFFFFWKRREENHKWDYALFNASRTLFTGLINIFFNKTFIKNGSHGTIHTFKIILLHCFNFQQNKQYPNTPLINSTMAELSHPMRPKCKVCSVHVDMYSLIVYLLVDSETNAIRERERERERERDGHYTCSSYTISRTRPCEPHDAFFFFFWKMVKYRFKITFVNTETIDERVMGALDSLVDSNINWCLSQMDWVLRMTEMTWASYVKLSYTPWQRSLRSS